MKDTAFRKKNTLDVHRKATATTRSTVVWAIARRRPRMTEDKIHPFDSLQSLALFTTSLYEFAYLVLYIP
jgi:hypothetical protein